MNIQLAPNESLIISTHGGTVYIRAGEDAYTMIVGLHCSSDTLINDGQRDEHGYNAEYHIQRRARARRRTGGMSDE